jgi:chromosome segregation protein
MFAQKHNELNQDLEKFINEKQSAEEQLKDKRDQLAIKETALREKEQVRLTIFQEINPISEAFQAETLKEQQTKIDYDYSAKEFLKFNTNDDEVASEIDGESATSIGGKIEKLNQKIERIGPINMAAVSELESERERVAYIASQVEDLSQASATLEEAIGKIDRETRDKLKETYNSVNQNLNDYFRKLFGGGKAVLELLGNEILDTGLQIVAQPPGKKNTTIHLLSGGEKALTAIALVFALFRLNPAPFCLLDEVDAPLDDSNTERFCELVKEMSSNTQFLYVSHNKITMELAEQLIGVTMQESGVSKIVEVDLNNAKETPREEPQVSS